MGKCFFNILATFAEFERSAEFGITARYAASALMPTCGSGPRVACVRALACRHKPAMLVQGALVDSALRSCAVDGLRVISLGRGLTAVPGHDFIVQGCHHGVDPVRSLPSRCDTCAEDLLA